MGRIILTDKKTTPPLARHEHIVSRFYLDGFADNERFFWVYKKGKPPRKRSTKGQASETDYFEYVLNKQPTNNKHEQMFTQVENRAARVLPKIVSGSESLSQEEVMTWALFVSTLFLRSRKVRNQIGPKLLAGISDMFLPDDRLREMQYDLLKQGEMVPIDELRAKVTEVWGDMNGNPAFAHMAGIEDSAAKLGFDILQRTWHTLEAEEGSYFVTSDCPVVTLKLFGTNAGGLGAGFSDPNVAIILTLSPEKVFVASPTNANWKKIIDADGVRKFNAAVVNFADRAVYSHQNSPATRQLVDEEINTVVFGTNAFVG